MLTKIEIKVNLVKQHRVVIILYSILSLISFPPPKYRCRSSLLLAKKGAPTGELRRACWELATSLALEKKSTINFLNFRIKFNVG